MCDDTGDTGLPCSPRDRGACEEVLLREVHHRVRNNLQVVCSFLSLQVHRYRSRSVRIVARQTQVRLQAIALVHDRLSRDGGQASLRVDAYVEELLSVMSEVYGLGARGIALRLDCRPLRVSGDDALRVGLIVNELASNAVQHAFPHRTSGNVRVTIRRSPRRAMAISVSDDGAGLPAAFVLTPSRRGLGLAVVSNIAVHSGGRLRWSRRRPGVQFTATLGLVKDDGRDA